MEISDDKMCVFTNGQVVNISKNEPFSKYLF